MTIQRGSDHGKVFFIVITTLFLVFLLTDKFSEDICLVLVATFLQIELQTLFAFETIL